MKKSTVTAAILALALMSPAANAAELKVLAGGAFAGPLAEIGPKFESAFGHKLVIVYGAVPQLIKQAAAGEPFDVGILPRQVFADAAAAARFPPGPKAGIARVGYGVAVKAGAPKPDVSTPDALKATLLKAQSVVFLPESAAGAYVMSVFDRLGIGEAMKAKTKPQANAALIAQAVANGDAELGVFLINVFVVPGVDIAGPFPGDLQQELIYEGVSPIDSKQADAAKAFIDYLRTPEAVAVMKAKGVTPG
jgi:molybdate transport system substrate-binding protein